jgi:flagellar basal-body rod modification protein FlgD
MAAMAGLMNQSLTGGQSMMAERSMTAGQALGGNGASPLVAAPMAASDGAGSGSSDSSSATISANDFLTLLVTEMQNQDPTAQTDPNEYINQLVQVNSLEQLLDINQNLSTALGSPTTGSGGSGSSSTASVATANENATDSAGSVESPAAGKTSALIARPAMPASGTTPSTPPGSNVRSAMSQIAKSAGAQRAPGNLSVPTADAAATRVGHALDGHTQRTAVPGKLPLGH